MMSSIIIGIIIVLLLILYVGWKPSEGYMRNEWDDFRFGQKWEDWDEWDNELTYLPACETCKDKICQKRMRPGDNCIITKGAGLGLTARCGTIWNNSGVPGVEVSKLV
jgi:hypothetical protein